MKQCESSLFSRNAPFIKLFFCFLCQEIAKIPKLTDANFPNIQYLAFEIKIFIKKIYVYQKYVCFADLSAEELQLLIKTKSMAVNRQTDNCCTYDS